MLSRVFSRCLNILQQKPVIRLSTFIPLYLHYLHLISCAHVLIWMCKLCIARSPTTWSFHSCFAFPWDFEFWCCGTETPRWSRRRRVSQRASNNSTCAFISGQTGELKINLLSCIICRLWLFNFAGAIGLYSFESCISNRKFVHRLIIQGEGNR